MKKEITKKDIDTASNNHVILNAIIDDRKARIESTFERENVGSDKNIDISRGPFPTISTKNEINILKKGKIPPEVIYTGEAGKKLLNIDKRGTHLYSLIVNNGISYMFMAEGDLGYYAPKLEKCLGETKEWLDIGTGNGVVSNMVALALVPKMDIAKSECSMKALIGGDIDKIFSPEYHKKPYFIACDLSKESLGFAKDLANNHFHDLGKFFTLQYYPDTFQKFLQSKEGATSPRLITMFNVLTNSEYEDLKKILTDMYASMNEKDVFIPTFFQTENRYDKSFQNSYNTFGMGGFRSLSMALYNNKETRDRCISSFCTRYKVNSQDVMFNITWDNDGRDFIEVSILMSPETILHIPQEKGKDVMIKAGDQEQGDSKKQAQGLTKFNVFKSYRMSKQQIEKLCTSIGFKIDYRLDSRNGIQIAPVMYK